jgi:hypothetical protein
MKTLLLLLLLVLQAHAHVGSPNVFFEGHAGPHAVRVSIRPPNALPGVAQVDVRVTGEGVTAISVQPVFWQAGATSAPEPVQVVAVAGDAHLFNAAVWLLRRGSYSVQVTIESPLGRGTVAVPLQAAALVRPDMPPALGILLSALGTILFFSAVWIAAAASARRRTTAVVTSLVLTAAISGGAARWRQMDRDFRNNALAKPIPVNVTVRDAGPVHLLRLTPDADATADWTGLAADHGKLMHLFLVHADDGNAFAHLHPVRRDVQSFEGVLPPLPAGGYHLYGEITRANGASETLTADVTLPAPRGPAPQATWIMVNDVWCQSPIAPVGDGTQPFALDADDSWHVGPAPAPPATRTQVSRLMGGSTMVFQNAGDLVADHETTLRFTVFSAEGEAVALQPYMGMLGHSAVRRDDGSVFTHLHPLGTISMAAQEIFTGPMNAPATAPPATNEVAFPYAFPRPGEYRVWTQVRVQGRIVTGVFDVRVRGE